MPKIKQLSVHEALKIAAGQVVERPANVVKELIENALDAQATMITLSICDGGKTLIKVADNGCGMDEEDAKACFLKHATSKIESIDNLQLINTFGFRGEALASVAATAQVVLITKTAHAAAGTKVAIANSIIESIEPVACNTGTEIAVHNLFFNIPARKKFLKTKETEWRQILQLFQAFCLSYPAVHFKLISEQKQLYTMPPVADGSLRCSSFFEMVQHDQLLPVHAERSTPAISITGSISNHQTYRYDRSGIFIFVNSRWVKDSKLANAVIKGYHNVLPAQRYPIASINITIDPACVDINIHPRKEEVRFLNPIIVEQLISQAVKTALENNLAAHLHKPVQIAQAQSHTPAFFQPIAPQSIHQPFDSMPAWFNEPLPKPYTPHQQNAAPFFETQLAVIPPAPTPSNTPGENTTHEEYYQLLGQLKKTYLLVEKHDGLFMVDQHAAHERILYERFANRFEEIVSVPLLFSYVINLSARDIDIIIPYLPLLKEHGIDVEPLGANQLIVQATPVHAQNNPIQELIHQMVGWITEAHRLDTDEFTKTITHKLRAQMACKAAVKAGDVLGQEQMEQLLADLQSCPNNLTCPHGRPTGWLVSDYEIEKKFKRKV